MKRFAAVLSVIFVGQLQAQSVVPPPPPVPKSDSITLEWRHSVVSGLTVSQVSFKDWAQGGEDALAWTVRLDGRSVLDDTTFSWGNSYKMSYGQARTGTESARKTEDRLEFGSVFIYKLGTEVNPYVSVSLKTQFAEGVTIDATGKATPVSKFFDPGYVTESAGFGYRPSKEFRTRLGAGLREIVTSRYRVYANDPSIPIDKWAKVRVDGGLESVTDGELKLDEHVLFRSNLELFSPIRKPSNVAMRMDNTVIANVSKYVVVILSVQLINDVNASTRLQVKEVLALGLTYTLF
jgi:hypothetical protein